MPYTPSSVFRILTWCRLYLTYPKLGTYEGVDFRMRREIVRRVVLLVGKSPVFCGLVIVFFFFN